MAARWSGRLTSAALILIVLALAVLLYSPWHRHSPAARQACIFSPIEAAPSLEAAAHIHIEPLLGVLWIRFARTLVSLRQPDVQEHPERAPPA